MASVYEENMRQAMQRASRVLKGMTVQQISDCGLNRYREMRGEPLVPVKPLDDLDDEANAETSQDPPAG